MVNDDLLDNLYIKKTDFAASVLYEKQQLEGKNSCGLDLHSFSTAQRPTDTCPCMTLQ